MGYAVVACRALVLVVCTAALLSKLRRRRAWVEFVASVRDLRLLPDRWAGAAARSTAAAEAGVAVSLVVPSAAVTSTGLLLAGVLLACLGGTVLLVVRRGVPATCRCFGASVVPLQPSHAVRNGLLAAAALAAAAWTARRPGAGGLPEGLHPGGVAVALAAGALAGVLVVAGSLLGWLFAASGSRLPAGTRHGVGRRR